ncbi:MAG: succinate--CoA ligase subunit alpha [Candidatus Thermoplasmatota archaeon]|nr:succinate--CoA ligase subunit alpha [Candidatus Thermoplasmatota archaeon]
MAVMVGKDTKVIVQGITGYQGQFHSQAMMDFGTNVVGGVTPGKGGQEVNGLPVFDSVQEAVDETDANASVVFVPARFAKDAALEALDAGVELVNVITEHIPPHDAVVFSHYAQYKGARVLGPNCPGVCSPTEETKLGILPNRIFTPGNVGIVSRSGTLTYEIVGALTEQGVGQSTCIGIGGDPCPGTTFVDALELFQADDETEHIVVVGEIGGTAEEEAAAFIQEHVDKPVYGYIAGRSAPSGKQMGHAGAIVSRGKGTAESKIEAFRKAGVEVADFPADIAELIAQRV